MDVLAVIHGDECRSGVFGEVIEERGHRLEEWSFAWNKPFHRPLDAYGAVFVFGGAMHADQDDRHPWLREEQAFIERLLVSRIPTFGVCLGVQLLAKAAHAPVYAMPDPEVGWFDVELTDDAADDQLFSQLPGRFPAFQWHYYTFDAPAGAIELARSRRCTQAFRLGECAWGIQFHAEVTGDQVARWIDEEEDEMPVDPHALLRDTDLHIAEWNALGRNLCDGFLEAAGRVGAPA